MKDDTPEKNEVPPLDGILQCLISTSIEGANATDGRLRTTITVTVGGMLVCGEIVSFREYLLHHPMTSLVCDALDSLPAGERAEAGNKLPKFLHLKGAKFFHPAGKRPLPDKDHSHYWRCRLSEVSSFMIGHLASAHELKPGEEPVGLD